MGMDKEVIRESCKAKQAGAAARRPATQVPRLSLLSTFTVRCPLTIGDFCGMIRGTKITETRMPWKTQAARLRKNAL
jgi:hypothetical protein